jgi:sulfite exporter TauE/SafE
MLNSACQYGSNLEKKMNELWIAFITGLTTGGLSCLAVQGGLLASSLATQVEADMSEKINGNGKKPQIALPILLFLAAKLAAYTLLGFLLGWVGSVLQLNPITRAVLQIAIGLFMVGQALRIFKVHPIFRYFNIEPPAFITRYIRRKSRNSVNFFSPIFLGALTVLIPCGITQAMMAAAMGTGNPATGAALMFAFILGTSPVFFLVSYFATKLGSTMEKYFMKFVGVVILILGLVTINTGLNLMGSPVSFQNLTGRLLDVQAAGITTQAGNGSSLATVQPSDGSSLACGSQNSGNACGMKAAAGGCPMLNGGLNTHVLPDPQNLPQTTAQPQSSSPQDILTIQVTHSGYEPNVVHAPGGVPIQLQMVTNNTQSCSRSFVIPGLNIQKLLPESGTTVIDIPAQAPGSILPFSCSMGMYTGQIVFD